MKEENYMKLALRLAEKGIGAVSPNPMVGAVLVKNGEIVGKGYHRVFGGPHAEVNAIFNAKEKVKSSTLFINLEPCNHFGKTPPCIDAIKKAGIKKVVIAIPDPNPISKNGIRKLRRSGILVETGILEKEAKKLNEAYMKFIKKKMPFVTVKGAMSIDGKIATEKGESKWISSETSRKLASKMRSEVDGVLVGVNTIIKDDPCLIPHGIKAKRPVRVIVDTKLRIPTFRAKVLDNSAKTIVATSFLANSKKINKLQKKGIEIIKTPLYNNMVNLKILMKELAKRGIMNVLIEGGGNLIWGALKSKIVDKMKIFIAPKIIGGKDAPSLVEGKGIRKLKKALLLKEIKIRKIGEDFLLEGYVFRNN